MGTKLQVVTLIFPDLVMIYGYCNELLVLYFYTIFIHCVSLRAKGFITKK